jgi:pyruvate dehydrogenase E2 component (dihydrolipoamide acetyltransferase)
MSVFTMPSLGADMEAGKLVEWLVGPGDSVARGDVVAVVETQKGAIEIEIFEAGEVAELLAEPGQTLPVGAPLARIRRPGEADEADETGEGAGTAPAAQAEPETRPSRPPPREPAATPAPEPTRKPKPARAPVAVEGRSDEPALASPAARARAAEAGIDLSTVSGSGPGGAVLLADVEKRLAKHESPAPATGRRAEGKPGLDMAEMRRAIAAAMTRAKREIPHYYLAHEIDLQNAQDWLSAENTARPPDSRLLMGALLVRATVRALSRVPELNGRYEGDPYSPFEKVHCGLAVAMRGGGLVAPAILDAQSKDPDALMEAMRDLVTRTRSGRLRMSEITHGTITVSSLGETGVDALFGVIYPPQVALVGFGAPRPKPVVEGDAVVARVCVTASLSADHRVSDGRRGAALLAEIDRLLQEPESL